MRKIFTLAVIIGNYFSLYSQSNPTVLRPDLSISQLMTVHGGVTRLAFNPIDSSLYYSQYNGKIYKVINPVSGGAYDTLMFTTSDHGLTDVQGMEFHDSTLYVSGNIDPDSALTIGRIAGGRLQPNGTINWYTVAQTVPYETAGIFDHLFSGLGVNKTGDTIFICSGSRGDHGEVETRNGLYPGLRNLAITSVIMQIPAASVNLVIPNDSSALDAMGLLFARGIRNTYDFAYNSLGDLFGTENSGDRDMEDEINWLRPGSHYGFPWIMGSLSNPQQFAGYDSATDLLINHNSTAWNNGTFYDDPQFPQIPPGLQLSSPCKNNGPDAAFVRDSASGITYDAGAVSQSIYSLTAHRSPLGITFDTDSILGNDLRGKGFVLSFTRGDALLNDSSPLLIPFNDPSEDLLMLDMQKDTSNANYSFHAYKIVKGFAFPIDAILMDTVMYVIEYGYTGTQALWAINFPRYTITGIKENNSDNELMVYPVPADQAVNFYLKNTSPNCDYEIKIFNQQGQLMVHDRQKNSTGRFSVNTSEFAAGTYFYTVNRNSQSTSGRFEVMH